MLRREEIAGHRIANVFGDSSLSDPDYNYTDFVYLLSNGLSFRLPTFDDSGDFLPLATVTEQHKPLVWQKREWFNNWRRLWRARIIDILMPVDEDDRFPGEVLIALSSGWYVRQMSGGPRGIAPMVYLVSSEKQGSPMCSVWQ